MKISIYELLGLIIDGKAPKKISVVWTGARVHDLYQYNDYIKWYETLDETTLMTIDDSNDLYCEVEIIEEEKEIEKIPYHYNFGYIDCGDLKREVIEELSNNFNYFADKINDLIDEIKKLKESK